MFRCVYVCVYIYIYIYVCIIYTYKTYIYIYIYICSFFLLSFFFVGPKREKSKSVNAPQASSKQTNRHFTTTISKKKIKSYIRDNIHILNSISQKNDPDTLIVTLDVTTLYSNISHELGKQAISFWIDKYPEANHRWYTTNPE